MKIHFCKNHPDRKAQVIWQNKTAVCWECFHRFRKSRTAFLNRVAMPVPTKKQIELLRLYIETKSLTKASREIGLIWATSGYLIMNQLENRFGQVVERNEHGRRMPVLTDYGKRLLAKRDGR